MTIAYVANTGVMNHVEPGDPVTTGSVDTTGVQLLVATVGFNPDQGGANASELITIEDSKGNTWARAGTRSTISGSDASELWYSVPTSVGTGHTFSANFEAATYATLCVAGYNGFTGKPTLDQVTGAVGDSTDLDAGTLNTTVADSLIVSGGTHLNASAAGYFIDGANFTIRAEFGASSATATGYIEDRVVASTGAYATPASVADSGGWAARGANFYSASIWSNALLVVADSAAPTAGDAVIRSMLEAKGFVVTYRSDEASEDASGQDVIVIAESVSGGTLTTKYATLPKPTLLFEFAVADDRSVADTPTTETTLEVDILASSDPLAGGLSGSNITLANAGVLQSFDTDGTVAAGFVTVADVSADATRIALGYVPSGGALLSGNAPALWLFVGIGNNMAADLTANGTAIINAAIDLLIEELVGVWPHLNRTYGHPYTALTRM